MSTSLDPLPSALANRARPVAMEAGDRIFRRGAAADAIYRVDSGVVRLVRHGRDGEEVVLHEARAGEFFAEASLDSARYHCDAVALTAGRLLRVPADDVRALLGADPAFAAQWAQLLARQLRAARARLERLSLKTAAERIRHLLVSEGRGPRHEIAVDGTLKDLAARLGLTHEALYRTLARMEAAGEIERAPGRLRFRG